MLVSCISFEYTGSHDGKVAIESLPMQSRRRFVLDAVGAAALAAGAAHGAKRRPNIVWFMYDDLGSAELGCFGQKRIKTPHSDRLAREGLRLTSCYAGGSVCAPSRSVLMTGLHLGHTPVRANALTVPLEPGDVTVAELLQQAGYTTGGFGKWGLGDANTTGTPKKQGFDEFFGYLHQTQAHNYWPEYLRDGDDKVPLQQNVGRKMGVYSADLIAERMYRFLERNRSKPFFLYATPTLPHAEFHPPNEGDYANEPGWTPFQKKYAAMVSQADAQLGRILKMLDDDGLASNTIVFCTSDNGGPKQRDPQANAFFETNGPLRDFKGTLWEGGIRVPMIVRWPGHVVPGSVNSTRSRVSASRSLATAYRWCRCFEARRRSARGISIGNRSGSIHANGSGFRVRWNRRRALRTGKRCDRPAERCGCSIWPAIRAKAKMSQRRIRRLWPVLRVF
jgi:arylsulfatase A-like enzyme